MIFHNRRDFRRGQELYQRSGCVRRWSRPMKSRRKHRDVLDVGWQRTHKVDALHHQQLAYLREADLTLAARHRRAYRQTGTNLRDLRRDLTGKEISL